MVQVTISSRQYFQLYLLRIILFSSPVHLYSHLLAYRDTHCLHTLTYIYTQNITHAWTHTHTNTHPLTHLLTYTPTHTPTHRHTHIPLCDVTTSCCYWKLKLNKVETREGALQLTHTFTAPVTPPPPLSSLSSLTTFTPSLSIPLSMTVPYCHPVYIIVWHNARRCLTFVLVYYLDSSCGNHLY